MGSFGKCDTLRRAGNAVREDFWSRDEGEAGDQRSDSLGALIIQTLLNTADEETVENIEESPYLQYFLGLGSYITEPIIESSSLTRIRQRLSAEDWQAINELAGGQIQKGKESPQEDKERRYSGRKRKTVICPLK